MLVEIVRGVLSSFPFNTFQNTPRHIPKERVSCNSIEKKSRRKKKRKVQESVNSIMFDGKTSHTHNSLHLLFIWGFVIVDN